MRLPWQKEQEPPSLTVTFPKAPHNFCSKCGEPMVEGYMVIGRGFDTENGNPVLYVLRDRMCVSLHKKERPEHKYEDGEIIPNDLMAHDGYPYESRLWGPYGSQRDTVPDCGGTR